MTAPALRTVTIEVLGAPRPQGSKSISRNGHMYDAAAGLHAWRELIRGRAMLARQQLGHTMVGPIMAWYEFRLLKPRTSRNELPIVKPDLDKLVRAANDALTQSKLIKDDALIVSMTITKVYARPPGLSIALYEIPV